MQKWWLFIQPRCSGFSKLSFYRSHGRIRDPHYVGPDTLHSTADIEPRSDRLRNVCATHTLAIVKDGAILFSAFRSEPEEVQALHILHERVDVYLQVAQVRRRGRAAACLSETQVGVDFP